MSEVLDKPRTRTAKAAAPAPLVAPAPTLTLGAAVDKMWKLREQKRALEAKLKLVEIDIKGGEITGPDGLPLTVIGIEETVFGLLDAQDTRKAEGKSASVSITETVVANVENWAALWAWIAKTKNFHLVQKRVSDPGMRELWALGKVVPGTQPFTKRTLALRSL